MKKFKVVKYKNSHDYKKASLEDASKLLAEFFNGVVIRLDEEYAYDA